MESLRVHPCPCPNPCRQRHPSRRWFLFLSRNRCYAYSLPPLYLPLSRLDHLRQYSQRALGVDEGNLLASRTDARKFIYQPEAGVTRRLESFFNIRNGVCHVMDSGAVSLQELSNWRIIPSRTQEFQCTLSDPQRYRCHPLVVQSFPVGHLKAQTLTIDADPFLQVLNHDTQMINLLQHRYPLRAQGRSACQSSRTPNFSISAYRVGEESAPRYVRPPSDIPTNPSLPWRRWYCRPSVRKNTRSKPLSSNLTSPRTNFALLTWSIAPPEDDLLLLRYEWPDPSRSPSEARKRKHLSVSRPIGVPTRRNRGHKLSSRRSCRRQPVEQECVSLLTHFFRSLALRRQHFFNNDAVRVPSRSIQETCSLTNRCPKSNNKVKGSPVPQGPRGRTCASWIHLPPFIICNQLEIFGVNTHRQSASALNANPSLIEDVSLAQRKGHAFGQRVIWRTGNDHQMEGVYFKEYVSHLQGRTRLDLQSGCCLLSPGTTSLQPCLPQGPLTRGQAVRGVDFCASPSFAGGCQTPSACAYLRFYSPGDPFRTSLRKPKNLWFS